IPEGVTGIGWHAFDGCSSLTAINIPASVTSIGEGAFFYCSSLTSIVVAKGNKVHDSRGDCNAIIETNSNTLIQGCATTIIPESVTSIGYCAFYACISLTAITIPEGVTSIGSGAFSNCRNLTSITIPESVTSIGDYVFYGCSRLTAITIPEGVTGIGYYVFSDCTSLTAITIPEGVTSIEWNAFSDCSSLTTIMLPKSVKSIGSEAFADCSELTDVYCNAETVPSTYADAFDGSYIEYATLHVPVSAVNEYKDAAPWSSFGTIKAIENVPLEKCATPTISYTDGKVVLTCATEGAKVITTVTANNDNTFETLEFDYIPTQTFTAYATKEHYENSDTVTLTLCWIPCTEEHEKGDADGILTIPAKPVLIQCQGGVITLSGLDEGTEVAVYTANGTAVATATATDGTATLTTDLTAGTIAIVKTGDYSIKVAIK
ncbi:MAG: leucine-rich repeat domain-containing protein, partial [Bacteroidaceae bacterium]|nr:leucine-rich repeat domain-containing protein [Bacteroidaceae bacterium]